MFPFWHRVIDGFFAPELAQRLYTEFPKYDDPMWFIYDNPIEHKRICTTWRFFPPAIYKVFNHLCTDFLPDLADLTGRRLIPDAGLHGGGLHMHGIGGTLNQHLDYSIHPKLGLERKINLIVYLTPDWKEEYGGHLGFWEGTADAPTRLVKEIAPMFNRAVLFDTTQNSWHGLSRPMPAPDVFRRSIAMYYLDEPTTNASPRARGRFAPRDDQKGDKTVEQFCEDRAKLSGGLK